MSHSKEEKHPKFGHLPLSTSGPEDCALTGAALLRSPYHNKGSAFTAEERKQFKLHGLLPANVQTLEEQVHRAYQQYSSRPNDLAKNTFMTSMKEQNEVLYYRLIQDHLKEMFSVIYTPTEGDAIQNYSRLFRRPEGCFLNIEDQDRIPDDLDQFGGPDDIDVIVVSDGEQILGIGDQGVGGILISVAKLVIYTLCAGVHPSRTLPVVLDCGTDNEELLNDELYLGLRQRRVRGQKYDDFVDKFVSAARKRYPRAYIHFEDFGLPNARRILEKYTPKIACFNDDVQGTGCVTLAAVMAAVRISNLKWEDLRVIAYGSGTAGTGIADQLTDAISVATGKSKEDASKQIWCVDKPGLLLKSKKDQLTPAQIPYARSDDEWKDKDHQSLLSIVKEVKPNVLIGTSTKPGAFTQEVVSEMAKHVSRPIIFPLSNPTRLHEAKPEDLFKWTNGKCLVATGSPFPPVEYDGKKYEIAECNNSTTFPGIGLGAILSRTRLLPPSLLVAATKALADQSPALKAKDPNSPEATSLLPDVTDVREISVKIASAVIKKAVEEGLNQEKEIPTDEGELEEWVREQMWDARYRPLRKVRPEEADAHAKGEAGVATSRRAGSFGVSG
ncbi:hypothetical protein K490DRAFT_36130 [Saccharata proteae CBS 121410]|uniref:Malic enzyme n=1 Tax=Saccharata proteae CBS 121410 TaxID=1314787 RepID=A0A9P4HVI4_9PEZI|nr:hypothetical protein K490DRAFT_36130 [Saccharata proteae CBS 121410]